MQLTQSQMAQLMGLKTRGYVSLMEKGRRPIRGPRLKILERIVAEHLGGPAP